MRQDQWDLFKKAAKLERLDRVPLALIMDSPWLPGHLGIPHRDYYFDPDRWFDSNLKIMQEFAKVIVFPSWWAEYGMAIEPSAVGCKIRFHQDQPPSQFPTLFHLEDLDRLSPVDPYADGFMAAALHRYQAQKTRILEAGYKIRVATARGPACTAAFMRGIGELMLDLSDNPPLVHKLMAFVTEAIIRWLRAQVEVIGDSVEGIFILDDIVGLLSKRHYSEFAHPYLKQIFDAFPRDWVKVYHNDANVAPFLDYHNDANVAPFLEDLSTLGFDVLNWSHNLDIAEVRRRTGGKICLMGNVAPLETGTRGTPQEVRTAALGVLRKVGGSGVMLSLGGGVSPGMPKANIMALIEAVEEFNRGLLVGP
ncbi:MAG: uroporphyrinogen decarboxylase family protein [Acidobacteriia bacterium]|nr:uroporphyrinogen decarboxylase family protein [Terriglobia bacterium]